jgi:hypothetical protein
MFPRKIYIPFSQYLALWMQTICHADLLGKARKKGCAM